MVIYEKGNVVVGQMQLMCKLLGRTEPKNFLDVKYSNVEPYEMLKGKGVKPLGDARAPRQIGEAVARDGLALARDL
ncbi:MAG: hypothetical protein ABSD31_12410 [Candidatus Binataceae bacterium]|jgi:hypothetical protein